MKSCPRERYVSPDGTLTFVVFESDGEAVFGFEGSTWHSHPRFLVNRQGLADEAALREFIDDLLASRRVIAISSVKGRVTRVWVTDDPRNEVAFEPSGETLAFRYWDGSQWEPI
jgi:hypothetical protein